MPELVQEYPGLVLFAAILALLLYGSYGGVRAFCRWLGICIEQHKVRALQFSLGLSLMILVITSVAVFSGLFLNLLGLLGLFALAYLFVSLLIPALSRTRRTLRKM